MAPVGERNRGLSMLGRLMDQNPYYPTWMHPVPYLDNLRHGEFVTALEHVNKFNIPNLAWDPILRTAALGQIGRPEEADTTVKQLISNFPEAASDPAHYLRGYLSANANRQRAAGFTSHEDAPFWEK